MDRERLTGGPDLPTTAPLQLRALSVDVYRAPVADPVRTAFGTMTDRPAVVVTVTGSNGMAGHGEIWCNFPITGAEHRARLVTSVLAPEVVGREWPSPAVVYDHLVELARILALQSGEPGPLAQAIAGIDLALWDLAARQAGLPLWRYLGGAGDGSVSTYASGIGPDRAVAQATRAAEEGHRAFKLKVGFADDSDLANLAAIREELDPSAAIAVDANQAWSLNHALDMSTRLAPHHPAWLEEPLAADRPAEEWAQLADSSPIPLAGGENLRGDEAFDAAIAAGALDIIQPDAAKWGGISAGLSLARRIMSGGRRYYPHYLGGGVGLLASAHLLAAAGGSGLLEVDCNPNPLRTGLAQPFPELVDGSFRLSDAPGLGVAPGAAVDEFRVGSETVEA